MEINKLYYDYIIKKGYKQIIKKNDYYEAMIKNYENNTIIETVNYLKSTEFNETITKYNPKTGLKLDEKKFDKNNKNNLLEHTIYDLEGNILSYCNHLHNTATLYKYNRKSSCSYSVDIQKIDYSLSDKKTITNYTKEVQKTSHTKEITLFNNDNMSNYIKNTLLTYEGDNYDRLVMKQTNEYDEDRLYIIKDYENIYEYFEYNNCFYKITINNDYDLQDLYIDNIQCWTDKNMKNLLYNIDYSKHDNFIYVDINYYEYELLIESKQIEINFDLMEMESYYLPLQKELNNEKFDIPLKLFFNYYKDTNDIISIIKEK